MEGEGFGVESIRFEVLMNFSKARHMGLELSRRPGKRKVAVGFGRGNPKEREYTIRKAGS